MIAKEYGDANVGNQRNEHDNSKRQMYRMPKEEKLLDFTKKNGLLHKSRS